MSKDILSQDVIAYLIENYYQGGDILPQEKPFISSHWRRCSERFHVEVDGKGNLVSLNGYGFDRCKWKRWDRRVLDSACILSHLMHVPYKNEVLQLGVAALKDCQMLGLDPTFGVFRQVCSLALLKNHISDHMLNHRMHVLMIGDGVGILSVLFKRFFHNSTLVLVDIGKTLLFQAYHCQKAHPTCVHTLASMVVDLDKADFVYCPTGHLQTLERFKFDVAVSIASMQEMNDLTIARYFAFLRKHLHPRSLFYCCNRESKRLVGGEMSEFLRYPWQEGDQYLVDEYCPWHQYFFSRGHAENGLHLFGIRIPFVNFYDGKHRHRLAVLATS